MNELIDQSSTRTTNVIWVTIHTAEGPTDEFPARPDLDSGSARDLVSFFEGKTDRSCHAVADDDVLIDNLIPYNRAAWTLRGGNSRSDNLEMCGLASWSRPEWLEHPGMLRNAARWVASRLLARGIPNRRINIAQCAAGVSGYLDHNTYTKAYKDGTHWDCGPDFPWDVFGEMVTDEYNGSEDDVLNADDKKWITAEIERVTFRTVLAVVSGQANTVVSGDEVNAIAGQSVRDQINKLATLILYGDGRDVPPEKNTHGDNLTSINKGIRDLLAKTQQPTA